MIRIDNVKLRINHSEADLIKKIESILKIGKSSKKPGITGLQYIILRQSTDARRKPEIFYVYSVAVRLPADIENKILAKCRDRNISEYKPLKYEIPLCKGNIGIKGRPVIVGSGPAGLFCAYVLCQRGYAPVILERGECVDERKKSVEDFWNGGSLKPDSNVQFGEGGAGTFSDGKLNTGVNDKLGRNQYVLDTFVGFGADRSIAYKAKPHIGTDILVKVVRNMREYIKEHGGCFLFNTKMTGFGTDGGSISEVYACCRNIDIDEDIKKYKDEHKDVIYELSPNGSTNIGISTNCVVLAIGHSARDTFKMLNDAGIEMVQKSFAVGLRIQHPQEMIDRAQYGNEHAGQLPAADYKLTNHASNGRSVYSFCMCPGGYVVNASSEDGRIAVNGMSYSGRSSLSANSAIIVSVDRNDFGSDDPLAGMEYQRRLEEKAFKLGNGKIPVQSYGDFRKNVVKKGNITAGSAEITEVTEAFCLPEEEQSQSGSEPSEQENSVSGLFKGEYEYSDLSSLFTESINEALVESIDKFGYTIKDFDRPDALLAGVESRTSSPVRILRDEELEGNIKGLYPCGEGAGYAGGITSAAMDGIRVAEKIIGKYVIYRKEVKE